MKMDEMNKKNFGTFCEGLVLTFLTGQSYWLAKDNYTSFIDLEWKRIKIEVKGTHDNGDALSFNIAQNYSWNDKNQKADVYVLVGWKNDSFSFWVLNKNEIGNKTVFYLNKDKKKEYEVNPSFALGKYIEEAYERIH